MERDAVSTALRQGLYTRTIGRRILHFQRLPSTMDEAARQAQASAVEGTVVVAEEQTAGRGRFQRAWVSPRGNLHLSVVLRPSPQAAPYLSMIAALAVVRAIGKATRLRASIKWPNDVMLKGRKAAGILVEGVLAQGGTSHAVLGMGVNVNLDPASWPQVAAIATSLSQEAGGPVSCGLLLKHLLQELDALYQDLQRGESPLEEWRSHLETLDRQVTVRWNDEVHRGYAEDVDAVGNLVLRRQDGTRVTLPAGEVTTQGESP